MKTIFQTHIVLITQDAFTTVFFRDVATLREGKEGDFANLWAAIFNV